MSKNYNFYRSNSEASMLVLHGKTYKKGFRKKTLSQKVEVGVNALVFSTITIICIVSLIYLAHSNKVATKGYELKQLKEERSMLMTENEIWNMKIARSTAIEKIKTDPLIAQMREPNQALYIRTDTAVAKK